MLLKHILGNEAVYYDLFLILMVYLSSVMGVVASMYLASLAGLIKDLLSSPIVGLNGFSFPLIAIVVNFIFSKFAVKKIYFQFAIIFSITIISNLIVSLIALILGIDINHPSFLEHLYMGLANGILFILLSNIKKLIPRKTGVKKTRYAV